MSKQLKDLHKHILYYYNNELLHYWAKTGNYNSIYRVFLYIDQLIIFRPILLFFVCIYAPFRLIYKWPGLVITSSNTIILKDTIQNYENIIKNGSKSSFIKENIGDLEENNSSKLSLFFIFKVINYTFIAVLQSRKYWFSSSIYIFKTILESTLFFKAFEEYSIQKQLSFSITSCDHSPIGAAFIFSTQKKKLFNIYIQHALIPSIFPPTVSDLCIFYDNRAGKMYKKINKSEKCMKYGIKPKENFEILKNSNLEYNSSNFIDTDLEKYKSIGLVLNLRTSADLIKSFFNSYRLNNNKTISVTVCPHPLSSRKLLNELKKFGDLKNFRDTNCEIYICGNTSSIMDIVLSGKKALYHSDLDYIPDDYYGLVEEKVIKKL